MHRLLLQCYNMSFLVPTTYIQQLQYFQFSFKKYLIIDLNLRLYSFRGLLPSTSQWSGVLVWLKWVYRKLPLVGPPVVGPSTFKKNTSDYKSRPDVSPPPNKFKWIRFTLTIYSLSHQKIQNLFWSGIALALFRSLRDTCQSVLKNNIRVFIFY